MKEKSDLLVLAGGAGMLSLSSVFVKLASVGPAVAGFYRMLVGGAILLLLTLIKREALWKGWRSFGLACLAGVLFAFDLSLWHRSIEYVGPGLATVLGNCQVFFLTLFGLIFLGEKIGRAFVFALPLASIGLISIVWDEWNAAGELYRMGVFLGLCTAFFYAAFVLTLRKSQTLVDPLAPLANIAIVSCITMLVLGLEGIVSGQSFVVSNYLTGGSLVGYGISGQVLGWVWITRGLKSTPVALAGLILLLQPALAFTWDVWFFNRPTDGLDLVGVMLVLGAIYLGSKARG